LRANAVEIKAFRFACIETHAQQGMENCLVRTRCAARSSALQTGTVRLKRHNANLGGGAGSVPFKYLPSWG
jgi:hypothetical protein